MQYDMQLAHFAIYCRMNAVIEYENLRYNFLAQVTSLPADTVLISSHPLSDVSVSLAFVATDEKSQPGIELCSKLTATTVTFSPSQER